MSTIKILFYIFCRQKVHNLKREARYLVVQQHSRLSVTFFFPDFCYHNNIKATYKASSATTTSTQVSRGTFILHSANHRKQFWKSSLRLSLVQLERWHTLLLRSCHILGALFSDITYAYRYSFFLLCQDMQSGILRITLIPQGRETRQYLFSTRDSGVLHLKTSSQRKRLRNLVSK